MPNRQRNGRHRSNALADLFDTLPPANRLEAEDELRAAGRDPDAIGPAFAALAASHLGMEPPIHRARRRWPVTTGYSLAASVALCIVGWLVLRARPEVPLPPAPPRLQTTPALRWPHDRETAAFESANLAAVPPTLAGTPQAAAVLQAAAPSANPPDTEEAEPLASPHLIEPGTVISAANLTVAEGLLAPGVEWAVRHGMQLHIVAPQRITAPATYRAATQQYSAQVRLAADGTLENYVAGLPFPSIDPKDPQAARKIMWNFTRNAVATDDLDIRNITAETGPIGPQGLAVEHHFSLDRIQWVSYVGRLSAAGRTLPNPDRLQSRLLIGPLSEPSDLRRVSLAVLRYQSPGRQDDTWLYLPTLRRVRRLSASQRSDPLFGQDIDIDSTFGFSAQLASMDFRLIGEDQILACMHARHDPVRWGTDGADFAFDDVWEVRRVYTVEATSTAPQYTAGKRLLFVDKDTWTIPISSIYDRSGHPWKVWIGMSHPRAASDGGATLVTPAAVMLDLQASHGTRVALTDASDVDWRVNQGEAGGMREESFTVESLIESGH